MPKVDGANDSKSKEAQNKKQFEDALLEASRQEAANERARQIQQKFNNKTKPPKSEEERQRAAQSQESLDAKLKGLTQAEMNSYTEWATAMLRMFSALQVAVKAANDEGIAMRHAPKNIFKLAKKGVDLVNGIYDRKFASPPPIYLDPEIKEDGTLKLNAMLNGQEISENMQNILSQGVKFWAQENNLNYDEHTQELRDAHGELIKPEAFDELRESLITYVDATDDMEVSLNSSSSAPRARL